MVSSCCGATVIENTDLCSACKEHCEAVVGWKENIDVLNYIKKGNTYCTENYDVFYEEERNSVMLSAKHAGHELSIDEFLSISDIETFEYYTDGEVTLLLKEQK